MTDDDDNDDHDDDHDHDDDDDDNNDNDNNDDDDDAAAKFLWPMKQTNILKLDKIIFLEWPMSFELVCELDQYRA